jgi:hypothetical protein
VDAIDVAASHLASIDERSYSRALLRDANALFDDIVFPMSFPWAHKVPPVMKMIPRDIDEMCGIMTLGINNFEGLGRFEPLPGSASQPDGAVVASRRSSDPGVIEYSTGFPPTLGQRSAYKPPLTLAKHYDDPHVQGELPLRKFLEVQARKRGHDQLRSSNLTMTKLSFRVGSTSSRSTIFETQNDNAPLLLSAELPSEVQDGKRMNPSKAAEISLSLGTYNYQPRAGLKLSEGGRKSSEGKVDDRVKAGRTRRIWAVPENPSQRSFKSILNGEQIENGAQKRPRSVKVGVRLNGALVAGSSVSGSPITSEKDFHAAIEVAGNAPPAKRPETRQVQIYTTRLMANTIKERTNPQNPERPASFTVSMQKSWVENIFELEVMPAQIECFASQDGLIYTVCEKRGRISARSFPKSVVAAIRNGNGNEGATACASALMDITSMERKICNVCWSATAADGAVLSCNGCGLTVHRSCYGCGIKQQETCWNCDVCKEFVAESPGNVPTSDQCRQRRWDISCSMCMEKGGSLARSHGYWIHDTCRIWGASEIHPPPTCTLCSRVSRPLIRCAAKNCQIMFHPRCALIVSNAADLRRQNSKKPAADKAAVMIEEDTYLTTQYRLATLEVTTGGSHDPKRLPIGFCGFHNPSRRRDLQGLYPGGKGLEGAIRIPPLYQREVAQK